MPRRDRRDADLSPFDQAVLALLVEAPASDDELRRRFNQRFGDLMPADTAAIMASLARLQARGLVSGTPTHDR